MSVEAGGLWVAVVFASVIAAITLAFSVYQANKGAVPLQRETMRDLQADMTHQKVLVEALQRQSAEQWSKLIAAERRISELSAENNALKRLTEEQAALINALQRQLTGLARGNVKTSKRLRDVLTHRLNADELKTWAFDLNVPIEALTGDTQPALVVSMLEYLERYGKLEQGLEDLRQRRPDLERDLVDIR